MTMRKIAEIDPLEPSQYGSSRAVEPWELDLLEEYVRKEVHAPLDAFLLGLIESLRAGKPVALYAIESNFPDTIITED